MDLEQLKDSWKQLNVPPSPSMDLPSIIRERGRAAEESVRKMKRNVLLEAIFLVLVYGGAISRIQEPTMNKPLGVMFALAMVLFIIYYAKKYLLLKSMDIINGHEDMYHFLAKKLALLKNYIRFYWIFSFVFALLAFAYIILLEWIYQRPRFYIVMGHTLHPGQEWIILLCWLLLIALLLLPTYVISMWFMNRNYGRHIRELESILKEMGSPLE